MTIAAVATVLYHSSQVAAPEQDSPAAEVTEAPAPIEPEATPSPAPEASAAPEQPQSPAIALPQLPDIFDKSQPEPSPQQEEQQQQQDAQPAPESQQQDSQLPTNATIQTVRGFAPGTSQQEIVSALGQPGRERQDGSARVSTYVYPEQVDLVYIYDSQDRLQQSEAYFSPYMDFNVMKTALNGMLNYRITGEIEQALEDVQRGRAGSVPIATDQFQGKIEQTDGRIYVGVWEK